MSTGLGFGFGSGLGFGSGFGFGSGLGAVEAFGAEELGVAGELGVAMSGFGEGSGADRVASAVVVDGPVSGEPASIESGPRHDVAKNPTTTTLRKNPALSLKKRKPVSPLSAALGIVAYKDNMCDYLDF